MICWQPLLKRTLLAATLLVGVMAGVTARPEAAQALPGVGVNAGAAAHFASTGFAYDVNAKVDLMGVGLQGMYWQQPGTSTSWLSAGVGMNVSPVPMISIAPGIGGAMLSSATASAGGPMIGVSAGFYPIALPVAVEAQVGAAYLNGSLSLPYSAGLKLSLFPFTAIVARYRGWEGTALKTGGPEVGVEFGF